MNRKVFVQLWTAKNLDNPFGNALKDAVLSIAEARGSGDYDPNKWAETMFTGFATSFMGSVLEEGYMDLAKKGDEVLNPAEKLALSFTNTYLFNGTVGNNWDLPSTVKDVTYGYFIDHNFLYSSYSRQKSFFQKNK